MREEELSKVDGFGEYVALHDAAYFLAIVPDFPVVVGVLLLNRDWLSSLEVSEMETLDRVVQTGEQGRFNWVPWVKGTEKLR